MKPLITLTLALLPFLPTQTHAQNAGPLTLVYTQPLEGVYSQDWLAQVLGKRQGNSIDVFVVGDGKLGDFFGVVAIDCETPEYSKWLATGGFVSSDSIPTQAITGIRRAACN